MFAFASDRMARIPADSRNSYGRRDTLGSTGVARGAVAILLADTMVPEELR